MLRRRSTLHRLVGLGPFLTVLLLSMSSTTCSRSQDGGPGSGAKTMSYTAKGVVKSIDAASRTIVIRHEDIPGYMKSMTMPFDFRDAEQVKGLGPGDKVTFTFTDEGARLPVQSIRKDP